MTGQATALKRARMIREVLLDHGVPEVSIELQQGRPSGGDRWNALNPVAPQGHHIASRPTPANPTPGLALVKRGRDDLPGPLCNGHAGVDLVYRIITLGWANHPGYGGPLTVRGPLGDFTIPKDNGRPYLWGTEYEGGYDEAVWDRTYVNRRTGKRMTFREFMGRANGALCEAIWLPGVNSHGNYDDITPGMDLSSYHIEHSTWTPRKIDRLGYSTASGRAEIRRYASTAPTPRPDQEDDMSEHAEKQIEEIHAAVMHVLEVRKDTDGSPVKVFDRRDARYQNHLLTRILTTVSGMTPADVDEEAVAAIVVGALDPEKLAVAIARHLPTYELVKKTEE